MLRHFATSLADQIGVTAVAVTVLILIAVFSALVVVAALVAVLAGRERGERARLVLGDLLSLLGRGGQR